MLHEYPNNTEVRRWAETQPWGHKVKSGPITKPLIAAWNKAHPERPYVASEARHGTSAMWGVCECPRCIDARRDYQRDYRREKYRADHDVDPDNYRATTSSGLVPGRAQADAGKTGASSGAATTKGEAPTVAAAAYASPRESGSDAASTSAPVDRRDGRAPNTETGAGGG